MAIIKYKDKDGNLVPLGASGDHTHSPESIGAAKKDHGHNVATEDSDGFMSSADKSAITELNDAVFGNNEKQIEGLVDLIGETPVSEQISAAAKELQDAIKTTSDDTEAAANQYTDGQIADLTGDAPSTLDTLGKIATATVENADAIKALDEVIGTTADDIKVIDEALDTKVPTTRTVNGKALSEDINLSFADVGASEEGHDHNAVYYTETEIDTKFNSLVGEQAVSEQISASISKLIKALSVSGTTITYTMVDGTTGTITTQDSDTTSFTITAKASDDDVVVLSGTDGTNAVTYSASHAKKGPSAGYTSGNATTSISGFGGTGTIKVPQITVDQYGHVTKAADEDITITIPSKPTVDSTLSSTSTNAIQNKVVQSAIKDLNDLVGETPVADRIESAISDHNHDGTYAPNQIMTGASSSANGASGLVPQPTKGNQSKFLRADGTWQTPYTHPTTTGNKHIPSGGSSGQFLKWSSDGTATWETPTGTTYSAGTGIGISGTTISNSGVRSVSTGDNNGTIKVNTGGTSTNVSVKGLGSAAYTDSTAYAISGHGHTASEVGAAAKGATSGGDFNNVTTPGIYTMGGTPKNSPPEPTSPGYYTLIVGNSTESGNWAQQIAIPEDTHNMYIRYKSSSDGWSAWKRFALSDEVGGSSVGVFSTSADGLVPKPSAENSQYFLNSEGAWRVPEAVYSGNSTNKMYLIGALNQSSNTGWTRSNSQCYAENGHLYSNGSKVLTEGAIQAGSTSVTFNASQTGGSWASKTITFPTAYSTKPVVTISLTGDEVQYLSDVQLEIYSGYFYILCHNSSSSTTTVTVNWIAVGQ